MKSTPYENWDGASFQLWRTAQSGDNREQMERLFNNLPRAMQEELTERQRQMLRMHFVQGMSVTAIAKKLGLSKSTVSRTIARSTDKLFHSLRYSL